jgi:hypothetical protein
MPSTIVKMSSGHARAWAHNQPVWLDEHGDVARLVTRAEQHTISRALERTARVNKSFRLELTLEDVIPTRNGMVRRRAPLGRNLPATPPQKITCAFEVVVVGTKRSVTVWFGSLRYATGREIIAAQLLADHGECVVHGRNGKCLTVLRDPLVREREPSAGRKVQWSSTPEERRSAEVGLLGELDTASVAPVQRQVRAKARMVGPQRHVYSPDQCPNDCRGRRGNQAWSLAKGAIPPTELEHHPVCKYARDWSSTLSTPETTSVLYDLELSRVARGAMPEEIAEADLAERTTTMRNITVAGKLYAVLPRDEAEQAEREARGEGEDEVTQTQAPLAPLAPAPRRTAPPTEQLPLRAASRPLPAIEPDGLDEPEPKDEDEEVPEELEALNRAELDSMLGSSFEPGDEPDGHEAPTEPAPPLPPAPAARRTSAPRAQVIESETLVLSADEAEREAWPDLEALAPEQHRTRAELTARNYLARSPSPATSRLPVLPRSPSPRT